MPRARRRRVVSIRCSFAGIGRGSGLPLAEKVCSRYDLRGRETAKPDRGLVRKAPYKVLAGPRFSRLSEGPTSRTDRFLRKSSNTDAISWLRKYVGAKPGMAPI